MKERGRCFLSLLLVLSILFFCGFLKKQKPIIILSTNQITSDVAQKVENYFNAKTRIYKSTNNFLFLGRNQKGKYSRYRNVKRKLKSKYYLYTQNKVPLNSLCSSIICYKGLCNKNFQFIKRLSN